MKKNNITFTPEEIETLRKELFTKEGRLKTQYAILIGGIVGGLALKKHKYTPQEQRILIRSAVKSFRIAVKLAKIIELHQG